MDMSLLVGWDDDEPKQEVAMGNTKEAFGRVVLANSIEEIVGRVSGGLLEPIQFVETMYTMALEDELKSRPTGYVTTIIVFAKPGSKDVALVDVVALDRSGRTIAYRRCSPNREEGDEWAIGTREDAVGEAIATYLDRPDDSR